MNSENGRTKRIIIFTATLIAAVLFVCFVVPRLIIWTLPFIVAFFIAKIIEPVVEFLSEKVKVPRKISSALVVVIVIALLVWLVSEIVGRIVTEIGNLVGQSDYISGLIANAFMSWRNVLLSHSGEGFREYIDSLLDWDNIATVISDYLTGYIWPTVEKLLSIVKSLPRIIIFIVALFLGTYFISSDKEPINETIKKIVPKRLHPHIRTVKNGMAHAMLAYIRAQLILMCVTFTELLIGFLIRGGNIANYALLLALVISIIDALPILGTGTVLIPWGVGAIISGDTNLGLYLLALYLICLFVRQMLEPRVLSVQIGLHPLVTLMTMYAGLKITGFLGMILGPVIAVIIKNLYDGGFFKTIYSWLLTGNAETEHSSV
ncbi:MAG: sporulation integral membrane protein YtvI [Clostridia bacterium]|nr:sporulation integral membrane protein YtvI [Clostridia bacterium]